MGLFETKTKLEPTLTRPQKESALRVGTQLTQGLGGIPLAVVRSKFFKNLSPQKQANLLVTALENQGPTPFPVSRSAPLIPLLGGGNLSQTPLFPTPQAIPSPLELRRQNPNFGLLEFLGSLGRQNPSNINRFTNRLVRDQGLRPRDVSGEQLRSLVQGLLPGRTSLLQAPRTSLV